MMCFAIAVLATVSLSADRTSEPVDLIELNHFLDRDGRQVYEQVVFYHWSVERAEYHVRAWCLVENRNEPHFQWPAYDHDSRRWTFVYWDGEQQMRRKITSPCFRESWTQDDPERKNKYLLPERERRALSKRDLSNWPAKNSPVNPQEIPNAIHAP